MKYVACHFLILLFSMPALAQGQMERSQRGLLDLSAWDFYEQGPARLQGEWEFYMSELVSPNEFTSQSRPAPDYIEFPSLWNEYNKALRPGDGYATYRLKIVIIPPRTLSLELPQVYSNYNLWINKELIATNGMVGTSEKTSKPQWLPQTVAFRAETDTLDLVLHVSNFHHAKGGVREPIFLGDEHQLMIKGKIAAISNIALFFGLVIIAVAFVITFVFYKRDTSILYAAGLSITWGIRSMFSNRYIANGFFPDFPWELCLKIEYITLYLMMIWAIFFLSGIFKNDVNQAFKYLLSGFNVFFMALTMFSKASLYTQFLPVYLSFCAVLLVYIIYVLIRALVYEREGVWFMISCLFLGVVLFSYDLFSYQVLATFNPIIINLGYLVMFLLIAAGVMYQLGVVKKPSGATNVLTYEDLYGTKEVKP